MQPSDDLTPVQLKVLSLLASGYSISQAAEESGVHRNTITNWRRQSVRFKECLSQAIYDRALCYRETALELIDQSFETLESVLTDAKASPGVRLKAALSIVNIATTQPDQEKVPQMSMAEMLSLPFVPHAPRPETQNMHNSAQSSPNCGDA